MKNNKFSSLLKEWYEGNLSFDERVEEVALMLSGDRMSMYALEHAKALLNEKK